MCPKNARKPRFSDAALELIMRDVLAGLEDLSTMVGFEASTSGLEVLAITPADGSSETLRKGARARDGEVRRMAPPPDRRQRH